MQKIQYLPVRQLKTNPLNPRRINKRQLGILCESIKNNSDYFETRPILCNKDFVVFAGNSRLLAARKLGLKVVPVSVMDIPEKRQRELMLRDNVQNGEWIFPDLKAFDTGFLSDVIGFSSDDLLKIVPDNLEAHDDDFSVAEELAKIKKPKTKLGNLIELGPHKLFCGDATDPNVLKKLFGNKEKASMIYSDPVYNLRGGVDYAKGVGGRANYGGNVNDTRTDEEYKEFLKKSLVNALSVAKDDCHVFYWSDSSYIWLIQTLYRESGIDPKRVCLWVKNSQNPTPGVAFSKCYEPCTYGVRGNPYIAKNIQNLNEVMNSEITTGNNLITEALDHLDLWFVKRLSGKEMEHATSKPPQLHSKAIRRCTRPGEIILDSFLGAGSTLIAGDQLKRRVYGCELEPVYCDVIVRRYEKLTGKKAKVTRV
jgi:DNA modification methylase